MAEAEAPEGTQETAQDDKNVIEAQVHQPEWATGGYPLDKEEDQEDDEEEDEEGEGDEENEEEEDLDLEEQLERKEDPDFDEIIDEQIQAGNIKLKVGRSTKRVMQRTQAGNILKSFFSCRHSLRLKTALQPIGVGGQQLEGCTWKRRGITRKKLVRISKRVAELTFLHCKLWRSSG